MTSSEIDAGRLVLRPIDASTARTLLDGGRPDGVLFAPDYPSQFSLEVMDLVAGERAQGVSQFGPFFMVRKTDSAVIGEIGAVLDPHARSAQAGYSVVESCWNRGYATEALGALVAALIRRDDVERVFAETLADHYASMRVMEKAGLRLSGRRSGEEGGQPVELVVYDLPGAGAKPTRFGAC